MNTIQKINKAFLQGPMYIILFGLIFFGAGAGLTYHQYELGHEGAEAQGEVIGLVENCDDDGCAYAPVVRFRTLRGEIVTYESSYSSSPPEYEVGEQVTVVYRTEAPEKANIKGEGAALRIVFMIAGGIVIIIGLIIFAKNSKASFQEG